MPTKQASNVDIWLEQETDYVRKALESASRHFDGNDNLTVNTLEAIYGRESRFGKDMRTRGTNAAAGHFHFELKTAKEYNLIVTKKNDQRFDISYASSAAARYLKDLDAMFSKSTKIREGSVTIAIKNPAERKKFVLAAYNGGQRRIADAQNFAQKAGMDPQAWIDVEKFLESARATKDKANEIRQYVQKVPLYESEFAEKSPATTGLFSSVIKKYSLPMFLFLGAAALYCQPVCANWVSALQEIYETPVPSQIRKNFDKVLHMRNKHSDCASSILDGEKFADIYPKRFMVLSLLPNSFGGTWAYIAVEGERKRTFRLWLYDLHDGEHDLRSVEELPDSMDEEFFGQLQDSAHKPFWI